MKPEDSIDKDPLTKDPISSAADTHPIGTGVGAVGGLAVGAAIGSALGPLGALAGASIGAVSGAIAGRGIAEGIDPDAETAYWQRRYRDEPYYQSEYAFDDYAPAYGLGWRMYAPDATFETAEHRMSADWERERGNSKLPWENARDAARASWDRVHRTHVPD